MKFKLVENINSGLENESAMGVLDEEVLNENDNVIKSLIHQYSNQTYTPKSFWVTYNSKYKDNWLKFIKDEYGKDVSTWSVHHINGMHPNKKKDINNNYNNLAFVEFHNDITIAYISCIEDYVCEKSLEARSDNNLLEIYIKLFSDIDALQKIILLYGKIKNIPGIQPSQIFRINMSLIKDIYNNIPDILTSCFNRMIETNSQYILPLRDIKGVERLMNNKPPIERD